MMFKQLWIDIRVWFLALFRRSELHRRTEEEIHFHLAMRQQHLIESGVPPARGVADIPRQIPSAGREPASSDGRADQSWDCKWKS